LQKFINKILIVIIAMIFLILARQFLGNSIAEKTIEKVSEVIIEEEIGVKIDLDNIN